MPVDKTIFGARCQNAYKTESQSRSSIDSEGPVMFRAASASDLV
jgi:hypothetical protein